MDEKTEKVIELLEHVRKALFDCGHIPSNQQGMLNYTLCQALTLLKEEKKPNPTAPENWKERQTVVRLINNQDDHTYRIWLGGKRYWCCIDKATFVSSSNFDQYKFICNLPAPLPPEAF